MSTEARRLYSTFEARFQSSKSTCVHPCLKIIDKIILVSINEADDQWGFGVLGFWGFVSGGVSVTSHAATDNTVAKIRGSLIRASLAQLHKI